MNNSASISCPNLYIGAFEPDTVDATVKLFSIMLDCQKENFKKKLNFILFSCSVEQHYDQLYGQRQERISLRQHELHCDS